MKRFQAIPLFLFLTLVWLFTSCSKELPTLHVFVWGEYLAPSLIEQFEKKHGCKVVINTFDSNEAMLAKLQMGSGGYDLIFPSNYYVDILRQQEMIQKIDLSLLPNLTHLDPEVFTYLSPSSLDYAIPFTLSYGGIAYRKDRIQPTEKSWNIFFNQKLKGRMTLLNDVREVFGAALRYLGYSLNTLDKTQIEKAGEVLKLWKKNLAKFESEQYKNGLATAEYLVVQGYSGDVLQIAQDDPEIDFFLPKEGAILSLDLMVIPNNAPQVSLAHAFIDFLLTPKIAALNTEHTKFLCVNKDAYPLLNPFLKQHPILFPSEKEKKHLELIRYLGTDTQEYLDVWESVKND